MEEYGQSSGVLGVTVTIGNWQRTTDARATYLHHDGEPARRCVTLTADGYIPGPKDPIVLRRGPIQHYFYPTT
jgi:hypothetical protein